MHTLTVGELEFICYGFQVAIMDPNITFEGALGLIGFLVMLLIC